MDVVFCGTPQFAVPTLQALHDSGFRIRLVVSQPDRAKGRGMEVAEPPVKQLARKLGIPVTQPEKIKKNDDFRTQLEAIKPDAIVVVAYGRIIPDWMLALPRLGNINLHGSLLPKFRGAAPIQWAIASGEEVTGVTTIKLDSGLDTGDILMMHEVPIGLEDTAVTLAPRLAELGAPLVVETLRGLDAGSITPQLQDHAHASLAPILKKEDGAIDFTHTSSAIYNRMRGFQPWPGAYTRFRGKTLQVHWAKPVEHAAPLLVSELAVEGDRLLAGSGDPHRLLELIEVQLEGKKRMTARDFINGYRPRPGELLG